MQIADDNRDAATGRISAEIDLALDEERRHIACEIHDTVNAAVLVIRMYADDIVSQAVADGHAGIATQAGLILAAADQAYADMRRLSLRLRPELLDALVKCSKDENKA